MSVTITGDTPWRDVGGCTAVSLVAEFQRVTGPQGQVSPLIPDAAALLAAAGPHARLMAAMSWVEQKHASYPSVARTPTNHNFLSLSAAWDAKAQAHTWQGFASFAACVTAWLANLSSPTGAYRSATTIRELITVYAPPSENDTERYIRQVCEIANRIPAESVVAPRTPRVTTPAATIDGTAVDVELVFGNVDVEGLVVRKDIPETLNTAWDRLGARQGLFMVLHRMYGGLAGTDVYFRGDARHRARTDYGVNSQTGDIWRWTDPLGQISPHASGPYSRPSGDAPALVAKLGQEAINRDGISVEIDLDGDSPVTARAWETIARLSAFWADWNQIPWTIWPINPRTGLTFLYWHREFNGGKGPVAALRDAGEVWCPGSVVENYTTQLIEDVRAILKAAQTRGRVVGTTKPTAGQLPVYAELPPTALALPDGVTPAMVAEWMGRVTLTGERSGVYAFDPNGPVTRLWLERGRRTGSWPQLEAVTPVAAGLVFRYRDGYTVLAPPSGIPRAIAA